MNSGIARGKFFTQRPSKKGDRDAKDTMVTSADMGTVPTYPKAEKVVSGAGGLDNPPIEVKNLTPGGPSPVPRVEYGGVAISYIKFNWDGTISNNYIEIMYKDKVVKHRCMNNEECIALWLDKKTHQPGVHPSYKGNCANFSMADWDELNDSIGVIFVRDAIATWGGAGGMTVAAQTSLAKWRMTPTINPGALYQWASVGYFVHASAGPGAAGTTMPAQIWTHVTDPTPVYAPRMHVMLVGDGVIGGAQRRP
jgi:hypothetical protein